MRRAGPKTHRRPRLWRPANILLAIAALFAAWYTLCALGMLYLRWFPPLTTSVQIQRRIESWFSPKPYRKQFQWTPISRISPHLPHAVIAAEDTGFYEHEGIDWDQLEKALTERRKGGFRGASTLSQQLVKNLFLTTHRNPLRKAAEFALVPTFEIILPKQRILELYLNVVEWGPGVYGAEASARYHYRTAAANLTRDQSARLAAILPAPRSRTPSRATRYSAVIQRRMAALGW